MTENVVVFVYECGCYTLAHCHLLAKFWKWKRGIWNFWLTSSVRFLDVMYEKHLQLSWVNIDCVILSDSTNFLGCIERDEDLYSAVINMIPRIQGKEVEERQQTWDITDNLNTTLSETDNHLLDSWTCLASQGPKFNGGQGIQIFTKLFFFSDSWFIYTLHSPKKMLNLFLR